nr:proteoglycan 4-like [Procambarus clarkii]
MSSSRPRRHSVVTLRLTVTSDNPSSESSHSTQPTPALSPSPTLPPRPRSHSRQRYASQGRQAPSSPLPRTTPPLCRTPTTPLSRTPTSPLGRTPSSPFCREPTSPMGRSTPSPVSPRSVGGRHFRYDMWAEQRGLRRRSSLLTVPSTHDPHSDLHLRLPRQRSSSIAGPIRPPDLARYLSEASQRYQGGEDGGSGEVSIASSFDESEQEPASTSPLLDHCSDLPSRPSTPAMADKTMTATRPGHVSPGSLSTCGTHDSFVADLPRRRRNSSADSTTGVCRLRQFSITSRGGVVNRGDSFRPRRSVSNTSVTSTVSSCSKDRRPSVGSGPSTPGRSKAATPTPAPQHRVVMLGSAGVGKSALITQFMSSEYMCAYDDSPGQDESGAERSVSVLLEGEEAELIFLPLHDLTQASARQEHADGWLVVYSVSDRDTFRQAATALGQVWALGHLAHTPVILVANKTDLERTRVVTSTGNEQHVLIVTGNVNYQLRPGTS